MENSTEKNKNKFLIFLVIVIVALSGYIIYDKVTEGNVKTDIKDTSNETLEDNDTLGEVKEEPEVEKTTTLSNDEAIKIGKELYLKAKGLYICQMQKITGDNNWFENTTEYSVSNGVASVIPNGSDMQGFGYNKVKSDVSNKISALFTSDGLEKYLNQEVMDNKAWLAKDNSGIFYCKSYLSRSGTRELSEIGISVSNIEEDEISFAVTDYMGRAGLNESEYNVNSQSIAKKTNSFKIELENGTWKIDEYTDSYSELLKMIK